MNVKNIIYTGDNIPEIMYERLNTYTKRNVKYL